MMSYIGNFKLYRNYALVWMQKKKVVLALRSYECVDRTRINTILSILPLDFGEILNA